MGGIYVKKALNKLEEYIVAISLFIMTVIAFANVLSRKVFKASWSFTEEITANLFILSSLIGASIAARKGNHLGLSIFTDKLPREKQKYISLITSIAATIFCIVLIKEGFAVAMVEKMNDQRTPALGWPEWIFGMFVPIGGAFMMIRFIQNGIEAFKGKEEA